MIWDILLFAPFVTIAFFAQFWYIAMLPFAVSVWFFFDRRRGVWGRTRAKWLLWGVVGSIALALMGGALLFFVCFKCLVPNFGFPF